jgi:phosphoribosylanthranilate isomerase
MTWVKICGMTNLEDATVAVEAGADAVGFVFYEKSPRNITVEAAREIVEKLPESVEKVGVFVGNDFCDPMRTMLQAGLTGTQVYQSKEARPTGNSITAMRASGLPPKARLVVALPMNSVGDASPAELGQVTETFSRWKRLLLEASPSPEGFMDTFLLDSGDLRRPGGTGKPFDWKKAAPFVRAAEQRGAKLIVAGGLTPDNVGEAINTLKPWGVDVASGVEARPGKKDPEKVRAFVKAVRDMDRKTS